MIQAQKKKMTGVKGRASAARRDLRGSSCPEKGTKSEIKGRSFFFFFLLCNCSKITEMIFYCVLDFNLILGLLEEAVFLSVPPSACVYVSSLLSI